MMFCNHISECPKPATGRQLLPGIDWKWLVIGIIVGILVLGILIIALIRLAMWYQYRKEYARFEKERKAANWSDVSTRNIYTVILLF